MGRRGWSRRFSHRTRYTLGSVGEAGDASATPAVAPRRSDRGVRAVGARYASAGRRSLRLVRSEEHPSELQSLTRISYTVFGLTTKKKTHNTNDASHY